MKVLYFGGQKSGKSRLAEMRALSLSKNRAIKPYYIATYDNSYSDMEMQSRVDRHKKQRADSFITVEESYNLDMVIKDGNIYLIDCISMWILNMLDRDIDTLLYEIELLGRKDADIIFVLNDVNSGVIPIERESRRFIDYTGAIGQKITSISDEVYEVKFGISLKLK